MALEDLGQPLAETSFVVLDIETTGGRAGTNGITEIAAVKVRGGEEIGMFSTLVNPDQPIPPLVTLLTGITDAMVVEAPRIDAVLPSLLEFLGDSVVVAHNAPFDIGHLRAECGRLDYTWPSPVVVDTLTLARKLVPRSEIPNHKLATLARFFGTDPQPTHRALADTRATVEVFHALLERIGAFGVDTLEELRGFGSAPTATQRRKRVLADDVPTAPGVYVFEDGQGKALYVGKSGNMRKRVRSYFTSAERRGRIREMLNLAERVTPIVCGTPLEAEVRELRLIAERDPSYNRRSRRPERASWIRFTSEPFPRLSIVRGLTGPGPHMGPFSSRSEAERALEALHHAFPLRQCTQRITPGRSSRSCVLAQLDRCGAPCEQRVSVEEYARHVDSAREAMTSRAGHVVTVLGDRIEVLAEQLRYEEAAAHRDRLAAFLRGATRAQRLSALASCPEIVAARPAEPDLPPETRRYEVCVVRHGRLAGTVTTPPGEDPWPHLRATVATAETVPEPDRPTPAPAAMPGEMECVLRWLERPDVTLVRVEGTWVSPVDAAQRYVDLTQLTDWHRGSSSAER
ncbi:DEDD exonuclease domain-containing protein [Spiractinospora alimapuensis]|nr:DEDD exonuclease domain-containing protein [Spiractinospora alimapuensis]